ncbi:hypothetical protein [Acinetobacter sp. A47]|uniref:hypothetical protein n=1 Tax=Acinetobacter sp. A47 TaxID=1561217 RepID=UPI00056DAB3F|nr:hypothetical protein [Acinetobacter sp. A47]
MALTGLYTKIPALLKIMFAFYPVFSTLGNAVTLSLLFALLKKTLLLATAPVIGVTIKSQDYRALPMFFSVFSCPDVTPSPPTMYPARATIACSQQLFSPDS